MNCRFIREEDEASWEENYLWCKNRWPWFHWMWESLETWNDWQGILGVIEGVLWRRQWHPTPVLLPGKSHGWRSLVGCSPWGRYESDATERLHFQFSLSRNGEGNGDPLQCSCLENPRDGRARWAAIYGVAQSRTRLKWLSSSRSCFNTYVY